MNAFASEPPPSATALVNPDSMTRSTREKSYRNDWTVFFTRPVSGGVMGLTALALFYPLYRSVRRRRSAAPVQP